MFSNNSSIYLCTINITWTQECIGKLLENFDLFLKLCCSTSINSYLIFISLNLLPQCTSSQTSLEEKCSISLEYDHHMTTLPLPPGPPPATICRSANHTPRPDIECTSERYWGDILERTFSSCSINALPRSNSSSAAYHQQQQHQTTTLHRHHHRQNGGGHHRSNNSIHKLSPGGEHLCKEHRRPGTGSKESEFTVIFPTTNSDPQMSCERELHDINCAKNRAFFVGFNHHQALPDI